MNYSVVKLENIQAVCDEIYNHEGVVAFSVLMCEDRALTYLETGDVVQGLMFSIGENQGWYFPISFNSESYYGLSMQELVDTYLRKILEEKSILSHFPSMVQKAMFRYGVMLNLCESTFIMMAVQDWEFNQNALRATFQDCIRFVLNEGILSVNDITTESSLSYVCTVCCQQVDYIYRLYKHLLKSVDTTDGVYKIEVEFSCVAAYSEYFGVTFERIGESEKINIPI